MKAIPILFPVAQRGYLTRGQRQSGPYDSTVDAALRVFETPYCVIITTEIGGVVKLTFDHNCHPDTLLEHVIKDLGFGGFVSNDRKLFKGKFDREDSIIGIQVNWESGEAHIERLAQDDYDHDSLDRNHPKPLQDFSWYVWINQFPNWETSYSPTSVTHQTCLSVSTSPEKFNHTLAIGLDKIMSVLAPPT